MTKEQKEKKQTLLKVENLKKTYWKENVLKWIDLNIKKGEVLWYIGPNGAGKTTTIKLLLGINKGDKGSTIEIDWKDVESIKNDNIISYLPEKINLPEYMTGREYLNYIIELAELKDKVKEEDIERIIKLVKFPIDFFDKKIKTYSKWMQQRLGLAAVLLNPNNKLIILDEPVSWLDPLWQDEMIEIIKKLKKEWKTIFITTHQMNEVEELCDSVVFVNKWKIIDKCSVKDAMKKHWNMINYYKNIMKENNLT